jgi:sugar O-acyltransferase (sialic acid O-acetyltransferase NeuD family)
MKKKKLVLVGTSALAEIAFEYFNFDSDYEVVAFSADRAFITAKQMFGLPVVPFEDVQALYPPADFFMHIAVAYPRLNRLRARFLGQAKEKGYRIASYVSSRAFVWRNVTMGENCFIFENNVVQPYVKLGNNIILWSGNHIGHHSTIGDNCFISSHVVVCGFCNIGRNCFFGVNSVVANNLEIGDDNWVGPGVVIAKPSPNGAFYKPVKYLPDEKRTAYDFAGIEPQEK